MNYVYQNGCLIIISFSLLNKKDFSLRYNMLKLTIEFLISVDIRSKTTARSNEGRALL